MTSVDPILVLVFTTPLLLAAFGEVVGQKAGLLNIGAEGMMLAGAFVGFFAADRTGSLAVGFLAAAIAGVLLAIGSGFFTIRLGSDQVVVGTAINFLALGATGLAFRRLYGSSGHLLSSAAMPRLLGLDVVTVITIALLPVVWFVLERTHWGLAVRACGEYPKAAEAAGQSVARLRFQAASLSGLLAGLGGAYLALGVAGTFAEGMSAGRGFLAIAVVTFGRWKPGWVALAAMLLGYAQSLQYGMQGRPIFGVLVPTQLWLAMPYVLALLVLVLAGTGAVTPAALGRPYTKER